MSIYYEDPDGNQVETQVDCFENAGDANAFMTSKEFGENPIGVDFIPEEIIARLEKGEDAKKIMRREGTGKRDLAGVPTF
jgi:hypothetical protein